MRAITEKAVKAFMNAEPFKMDNTEIKVLPNVTIMLLHGNEIAYKYNNPKKTISITNCEWFTNTTKERLNAITGVRISQKKGVWFLNGIEWNGKLKDID